MEPEASIRRSPRYLVLTGGGLKDNLRRECHLAVGPGKKAPRPEPRLYHQFTETMDLSCIKLPCRIIWCNDLHEPLIHHTFHHLQQPVRPDDELGRDRDWSGRNRDQGPSIIERSRDSRYFILFSLGTRPELLLP